MPSVFDAQLRKRMGVGGPCDQMRRTAAAVLGLLGMMGTRGSGIGAGAVAAGKPIVIGAHGDQAKQASYYTLPLQGHD